MIERLVENWLANAGELGFQTPFAQLLTAEGHRVLHAPVHHPSEHGKDLISISRDGKVCAFQLKGPATVKIEEFGDLQNQLFALAATAVSHASIGEPRRPDRVFLVTNGSLSAPVRSRIEQFNLANVEYHFPPIEPVEKEHLLARFIAAHGTFLPQALTDIRTLLEFHYADPSTQFPVRRFAQYLTNLLPFLPAKPKVSERRRSVTSAALLTAYAARSWTESGNHLGVAQAWLTFCVTVLRLAEVHQIPEKDWRGSYDLALGAAQASLKLLAREAASAPDVAVPDLAEGLVYPSRALLICAFLSALLISERTLGRLEDDTLDDIRTVITREALRMKLVGECDTPGFLITACALGQVGTALNGEFLVLSLVSNLAAANRRHSPSALPDPYHDVEQILTGMASGEPDFEGEEFDGRSYTLRVAIEWVARRLWRQHLAGLWYGITQVQFLEFIPSAPERYLAPHDDKGQLDSRVARQPQSWAALLQESRAKDYSVLPQVLRRRKEMLPFLPLLFPFRMTTVLAAAIDEIASTPDSQAI